MVDEVAHHFVGGRAGADDDARAHLGDRHAARAQPVAGLLARHEVLGRRVAGHEAAEIDDALDACSRGRAREIVGGLEIEAGEIPACRHRVDEVVGDVDVGESGGEGVRRQGIGLDEVDAFPGLCGEHVAVAGGRAHASGASGKKRGDEVGADIAARAEDEETKLRGRRVSGHQRSLCTATSRPGACHTPRSSTRLPSNTSQLCAP